MEEITKPHRLGSLFDGSGGFPLAGVLCGVEPCWASEVEPYPIAVTRERFPNMKHLGDISKINGAEIEPVDIITFGSPCQDLSVAGKRAGLKHEANGDEETTRSGLFMEAVRIIKEMRRATNGKYPRFALWENVPGAFSSNKGEDFRIVCEELIKIVEPSAVVPDVPKGGWAYADSFVGDGWSLAWRVFDAQYWGVPQRRRRIHIIADFRGECAREVLFEREGVRGYFAQGGASWQGTPTDAQGSTCADDREGETAGRGRGLDAVGFDGYNQSLTGDKAISIRTKADNEHQPCVILPTPYTMKERAGCAGGGKGPLIQKDKSATLATSNDQYLFQPVDDKNCYSIENHPADSRVNIDKSGKVQTLTSRMGTGGGNVPMVMTPYSKSARARSKDDATTWKESKVANTLNTFDLGEVRTNELIVEGDIIPEEPVICLQGNGIDRADTAGCNGKGWKEDTSYTLNTIDRPAVAFCVADHPTPKVDEKGKSFTLNARDYKAPLVAVAPPHYIVRRLTPTECARLQGFADGWGHIEKKDSLTDEEYKFWLEVRNTHAAINGKKVQEYTEKQMLTWYNKLWTDSAEYKMWGNGIALPPALYCLQGIVDVLNRPEEDADDWML